MAEISIIVPVYNTEQYIADCLDSIIGSSVFGKSEVIVIDDGSTDNSLIVAQEYAEKYENIYLFSFSNGGLSASRNRGLKLAKGEYIFFVDSDDLLEPNYIEKLYEAITQKNCDIVFAGFTLFDSESGEEKVVKRDILSCGSVTDGCSYLEKRMDSEDWQHHVWSAIYRRKFLTENNFYFCEEIKVYEDILFTNRILLSAERVYMLPMYGYLYRIRNGSLVNSGMTEKDVSNCILIAEKISEEYDSLNKKQKHAIGRTYFELLSMILYCIGDINSENKDEFYKRLDILNLWKIMAKSISNINEAIKWIIFSMNWDLYYKLYKIYKKYLKKEK